MGWYKTHEKNEGEKRDCLLCKIGTRKPVTVIKETTEPSNYKTCFYTVTTVKDTLWYDKGHIGMVRTPL